MASLTIRDLPNDIEQALIRRAAQHGRSAAEEALSILKRETGAASPSGLGSLLADIGREAGSGEDAHLDVRSNFLPRAPFE
jgi:plasmid stability protein